MKFGAWVACPVCGFEPVSAVDKAKSLMLSDHNLDTDRINSYRALIRHHTEPPYDPIGLAKIIEQMEDDDYFWDRLQGDVLPCMDCGTQFTPENQETTCPTCRAKNTEIVNFCDRCTKASLPPARFCEKCGGQLNRTIKISPRWLGRELGVKVRGLGGDPRLMWTKEGFVLPLFERLSQRSLKEAAFEEEIFVMYESSIALREVFQSRDFVARIVRPMLSLYEQGWVLAGMPPESTQDLVTHCGRRFDQYDKTGEAFNGDIQALAYLAFQNVFGRKMEEDLGLVVEWNGIFGLIYQDLRDFLGSKVFGS